MAKHVMNKDTSLLRLVKERACSMKELEEEKKKELQNSTPYLSKDHVSNILVRLPLESLHHSRFVCKLWFNMINSSLFIDTHLCRSETVLIFLQPISGGRRSIYDVTPILHERPNVFSVESNLHRSESFSIFDVSPLDPRYRFYIKFIEINDGVSKIRELKASCSGNIIATCNGLILLQNKVKKGGVIVMNPVTRKVISLPLGTIYPSHNESYGFGFNASKREYKVVHLFQDKMGYIGCEILNVDSRRWRLVDGPSFGALAWFGYKPVWAIGALHWLPQIDYSDYIVSMGIDDEKFHMIPLPQSSRTHDGLVEMGGLLCFVAHTESNEIDVWTLKGLCGESWIRFHSIAVGCIMDMVPLCGSRTHAAREMVFKRDEDGSFYSYDFHFQVMRKVDTEEQGTPLPLRSCYLPHVNSLVSWTDVDHSNDVWN